VNDCRPLCLNQPFDAEPAALIGASTKRLIVDAYSSGLCSEETAIRPLRENDLVTA